MTTVEDLLKQIKTLLSALQSGTSFNFVKITDGTDTALVTAGGSLNVLDDNSAAIKTAVEIMDDWDESDRAKVNAYLMAHATTTGAPTSFRSLVVDTDEVQVKASAGNLYGWNIINLHNTTIYVKFYNINGSVNPASDVPVLTLMVPSNGAIYQEPVCIQHNFTTAIAVRAVTGSGDTDATDPATLPIIELKYA